MKSVVLAMLMLFAINGLSHAQKATTPQIGIKVPEGETVVVDGVSIFFKQILEDSRCPKGLDCFWEGRARVLIEITTESGETSEKEVILGAMKPGESRNKTLFRSDRITITAFALNPYPDSKVKEVLPKYLLVNKEVIED